METVRDFIFLGCKITADVNFSHEIQRHLLLARKAMTHLDRILKSRGITLPTKIHIVKAMIFPVVMWELGHEDGWASKKSCFQTMVLEETLESCLDCKEIQPVHPKGSQSLIFTGRTDAEAETPILWQPDVKSWLFWKNPNAGKDWGQKEKGTTEDKMVGWHHWLNGHEFEKTPVDGQGSLACCSSWGHKESDRTEQLNWTDDVLYIFMKAKKFNWV